MDYKINIKPLSVNEAFKGQKFRTNKYDHFIRNMLLILPKTIDIPDEKNIKLAIQFGYSSKLSDCDNGIKTFLDCLVKKYGFDDRHIYELHIFKAITKKGEEFIKFRIY